MRFNVSQQMKTLLTDYTDEIALAVSEVLEDVGREAAEELHTAGGFQGRKYRRSWDVKTEQQRTFESVIVHNKKHYRLTHLLEFGHAKAGGGRTRAFPHIAPVNEAAVEKAEKRIRAAVEQIG